MTLKLSKRIPARTRTIEFNWCHKNFTVMNQKFREIRAKYASRRSPMDTCFWCGHKLEDGEIMAIAQPKKGANKVLCQSCADELLKSEPPASE